MHGWAQLSDNHTVSCGSGENFHENKERMIRKVNSIHEGDPVHWVGDGFRMKNYFPGSMNFGKRISPFFLLDYHPPYEYPPVEQPRGVGVHPHKGFETVTIAFEGAVAHHDSRGGEGVIRTGDVQWMTAGNGILHKEYHEAEFSRKGGRMKMLQLWVNLPAKFKGVEPKYQAITRAEMGEIAFGKGSKITLIAGEKDGIRGPASTFTPIHLWTVDMQAGDSFVADLPEHFNTAVLLTEGEMKLTDGHMVRNNDFILYENKGTEIRIEAVADSHFVLLSGEPIDEPVVHYGPFVMNNIQEIHEAIRDFQAGKFGVLED